MYSSALDHLLRQIGHTDLVALDNVNPRKGVPVLAKLEMNNLTGSVKDRPALNMIEEAEKSGELGPGKTILESTSGNTGIALAAIGQAKGYPVKLVVPETISSERKELLAGFGAEIILSDGLEGPDGAYRMANALFKNDGGTYLKADQYGNPANPAAHCLTTAEEIWEQTEGRVTHFVAATGTSGTLMGTGRGLKAHQPQIRVFGAQPAEEMHGVEGLKNYDVEIVPAIYDPHLLNGVIRVTTEDAYDMMVRLAREERIFAGPSGGLNVCAALKLAGEMDDGLIVTVLPDSGYRYVSTGLYPEDLFHVHLSSRQMTEVKEHAGQGYPHEVCGLLVGTIEANRKVVTRVFPCENINKDRARDRFEIDPREYLGLTNELNDDEAIIGIYHSHPDHPSRPSPTDLSRAFPIYSYFIAATIGATVSSVRSWILNEEESAFQEEFIKVS
ncbi:MAG: pyridoxal-phosphate dependent enzyme [bacterium]|nr:pyridoxal-phosphate dependent enzyme [bacterium]